MFAELTFLLFASAVLAFWYAGRIANEHAVRIGQAACARAGVQWLDQSVHLLSLRVRRGSDGWIALERHFGFEYSLAGEDRHAGRIVMHGRRLVALAGPMPPAAGDASI